MAEQQAQSTAQGHGHPGNVTDYRQSISGNPYAATPPRGNVPYRQENPQRAEIPRGPYNDPVDSHPGPVGPPAVRVWQEDSSSEFFRTHREHYYATQPQGANPEQPIGAGGVEHRAADPKWKPSPVIRTLWPPVASQFVGRPFDQRMTHRLSGQHESMAGRKRSYQLIKGERPVHRLTSTYRIVPPSQDELLAAQRGQPTLSVQAERDRTQNGSYRLL